MFALIIIIIASILFIVFLISSSNESTEAPQEKHPSSYSQSQNKSIEVESLDIPDDNRNGDIAMKIAGLTHYCSEKDCCVFNGIIFNEKNNTYNRNAMVIYSINGKKIGYIPDDLLGRYWEWSNGKTVTCVGVIAPWMSKNTIYGEVTAIKPCNESFVQRKTDELIGWYELQQSVNYDGAF